MGKKRRTEITVETHQVLVIRRHRSVARFWCAQCAAPSNMLGPEEAAAAAGLSRQAIYQGVKARQFHFTETADCGFLICLSSLLKSTRKGEAS